MTQKYHCTSPAADALLSIEGWQTSTLVLELTRSGGNRGVEELLSLAQQWRDYADRLLAAADESSAGTRQHLLETASRWIRMARKAELLAERAAPPAHFEAPRAA